MMLRPDIQAACHMFLHNFQAAFASLASFVPCTPHSSSSSRHQMAQFAGVKEFLKEQHLAPLLSQVTQSLLTLNKWDTVGKALQVWGLAAVTAHLQRPLAVHLNG